MLFFSFSTCNHKHYAIKTVVFVALNCTTQKKSEFFFQTQPLNDKPITLGKFLLWNQQIDDGGKNIKMQYILSM